MDRTEEIEDYLLDLMDINLEEENAVEIRILKTRELELVIKPIKQIRYEIEFDHTPITSYKEGAGFENRARLIEVNIEAPTLPIVELYSYTVNIKCSKVKYSGDLKKVITKVNTFSKRIGYEFITQDEKLNIIKKFFFSEESLDFSIKLINTADYDSFVNYLEDNRYLSSINPGSYPIRHNQFLYTKLHKYKDKFCPNI